MNKSKLDELPLEELASEFIGSFLDAQCIDRAMGLEFLTANLIASMRRAVKAEISQALDLADALAKAVKEYHEYPDGKCVDATFDALHAYLEHREGKE